MAWWRDFQERMPDVSPDERALELALGVSACFSPGTDGVPQLPVDTATGEIREVTWRKWLAWDSVRMSPDHADQALFVDRAGRSATSPTAPVPSASAGGVPAALRPAESG
jgi:hypothetical protein